MSARSLTNTTERDPSELIIRIAIVPCGASSAFLHPACVNPELLSEVEYSDLSIGELLAQEIVFCDGCGERIVPKGVSKATQEPT